MRASTVYGAGAATEVVASSVKRAVMESLENCILKMLMEQEEGRLCLGKELWYSSEFGSFAFC